MLRLVLVVGLIASTVLAALEAPRAQPLPSVSAACEAYSVQLAAMRSPVPPTVIIGAKTKAMALVGTACDQPSHAPYSALANVLQATNLLAVTRAHYPGATP